MKDNYTEILAEFAANLKYEDIPTDVIRRAKHLILHTIGASIAALPLQQAKNAIDYAGRLEGIAESTIWGSNGKKVPAERAAFANGTLSDIMDWEDCSWTGHPSAGVIPVALALAERLHTDGKELLTAIVAAYEVYHRIAVACIPSDEWYQHKAWGLIDWQIFAGTIAAAKLLRLDKKQIQQAMGVAHYMGLANVNKHAQGLSKSDVYHYAHGFIARNSINAAEIASIGFDNMYDSLDGKTGYWNTISDQCDWDWLDRDLGKVWYINQVLEKNWPANVWLQVPLEQIDTLFKEHPFTIEDVVELNLSPYVGNMMEDYSKSTRTVLDAQFNLSYCIASYLNNPTPGAHWFSADNLNSERILGLAAKVHAVGDKVQTYQMFKQFRANGGDFPEYDMEIKLKDGTILKNSMRYAKGHPKNFYTWEEEADHFLMVTDGLLPKDKAKEVIRLIDGLEEATSADELLLSTTV
ncbi:MAG: MmgE/PrpD family protein [Butyrivibrio sp.]|nr:MmgE/PrpD family protein [Butyrivibrio sp.]